MRPADTVSYFQAACQTHPAQPHCKIDLYFSLLFPGCRVQRGVLRLKTDYCDILSGAALAKRCKPMKRMLFNARHSEELRVAIVDGQTLLDLDIETLGKEQRKGNIYKGVITRLEPSLEACFVDYGTDRHGFLPFKEVSRAYFQDYEGGKARIQDVLKEGMQVIVQVEKDERGNKGAALTTFISLAGRYLVLMPNNPRGGGVSRRIEGDERAELKAAMAELEVPRGMSLIARTAGIGRSVEELQWDFNYLLQLWQAIEEAAAAHSKPYLLFMESSLLIRAIRDYYRPDIGEILVDNREVYEQVSEFMSYVMPANLGRLKLYEDHTPLFSRLQIEQQIETAFARSVNLPGGGAIVIDHTEALVSIDVNSARATRGADIEETAFKTNMEAAEEVARQMRLRDLGGLVVIDFIDMEDPKHQREVENTLRDALKKDRARVQMGKLSKFGLLELSRQRLKPALGESSHVACPRCAGTGVIRSIESTALHILRLIQDAAMKDNTGEVHVQVPVDVATFLLNEKRAELFGMEERLDVSVFLIPNTGLENPHYEITRVRTDDVDDDAEPSYKRVSQPENGDSVPFAGKKSEKAARPEPAVKGLKHASPAPVAKPSLLGSLKNWLGSLFGGSAKADKPAAKSDKPQAARQRPNRRSKPRSTESENPKQKVEKAEAKGDERADNKRDTAKADSRDNARSQQPKVPRQERQPKAERQNERQQNERAPKADVQAAPPATKQPENAAAETAAADNGKTGGKEGKNRNKNRGGKQKPLVVHLGGQENAEAPRQRKERNDKRRHIPSAAKVEQYFDVAEAALLVQQAAAHVLGLTPPPAAQPETSAADNAANDENVWIADSAERVQQAVAAVLDGDAAVQAAADSEKQPENAGSLNAANADAPTPAAASEPAAASVSAATAAVQAPSAAAAAPAAKAAAGSNDSSYDRQSIARLAATLDLGGLQLVETQVGALIAAAARLEPPPAPRLRRSDLPPAAPVVPQGEMIQVETLAA